MIGVLCGLAIYNFTIINVPFPLVLYKKLLNEVGGSDLGPDDLEGLSPAVAKGSFQKQEKVVFSQDKTLKVKVGCSLTSVASTTTMTSQKLLVE